MKKQVVIEIDEEIIKASKESPNYYPTYQFETIWKSICNGTVLSEPHGDLIDKQALINNGMEKGFCDWYDEIKYADIIIKASEVKKCR